MDSEFQSISSVMRWEKIQVQTGNGEEGRVMGPLPGPGARWGHSCNFVRGSKHLYVFGGITKESRITNQLHVFDTVLRTWSKPEMEGTLPSPRTGHSCTTVGDKLFLFGGQDAFNHLNDLHILDTSSNTWTSPQSRGKIPKAREGHGAALIGIKLFIFGGSGKSSTNPEEEEDYNDVYILNTKTFVWKRAVTSGFMPARRNNHTCSSWKNKIVVIGGEDVYGDFISDFHILDTDTFVWKKMKTSGQVLPPRAGHTTVTLGNNLLVLGGYADNYKLYDDVHLLDIETGLWTKVMTTGEGPFDRFCMAGDSLDPEKGSILVFIGGCNKNLDALEEMYYLHTGPARENNRDDRRLEKLSLRKELKLKCDDEALIRIEANNDLYQPVPVPTYNQSRLKSRGSSSGKHNVNLNEYQPPPGKKAFLAKVTRAFRGGYTIETVIDGKPLRGVLFSNKPSFNHAADDNASRKKGTVDICGVKLNDDHKSQLETASVLKQDKVIDRQSDYAHGKKMEVVTASNMKMSAPFYASHTHKVPGNSKPSMIPDVNLEDNETNGVTDSNTEVLEENIPAASKDCVTLAPHQDSRTLTAEEESTLTEKFPAQTL